MPRRERVKWGIWWLPWERKLRARKLSLSLFKFKLMWVRIQSQKRNFEVKFSFKFRVKIVGLRSRVQKNILRLNSEQNFFFKFNDVNSNSKFTSRFYHCTNKMSNCIQRNISLNFSKLQKIYVKSFSSFSEFFLLRSFDVTNEWIWET